MALKPGDARKIVKPDGEEWLLDDQAVLDASALKGSMALRIEEELNSVFERVKGEQMPQICIEDLRILFVAIARGVVAHLRAHPEAFSVDVSSVSAHDHNVAVNTLPTLTVDVLTSGQHDHTTTVSIT